MDAVIKHPSAQVRYFIETVLNFGRPFDNKQHTSLFRKKEGSFFYAANNSEHQASINAVDAMEWQRIHANEQGTLLHDINNNAQRRIEDFVNKKLNQVGYRLAETTRNAQNADLVSIFSKAVTGFFESYKKEVDAAAEIYTTASLRPIKDTLDFQLVIRFFLKAENETAFVSISIPNVVRSVVPNIMPEQFVAMGQCVRAYIDSYTNQSTLFFPLAQLDIVNVVVNLALAKNLTNVSRVDAMWKQYRDTVIANRHLFIGSEDNHDYTAFPLYHMVEAKQEIVAGSAEGMILYSALALAEKLVEQYTAINGHL